MKSSMKAVVAALAAALVLAVLPTPAAAADTKFGLRGGYYTDLGDPFLGAEVLLPITQRIYFNPNFEYVFVEGDFTFLTINADFHYDFPTAGRYYVWAGAGLALIRSDPPGDDNGDTDPGLNLLAGVGFQTGSVIPYFQAKLILDHGSEFVLGFGVRF
jgi:hypothetical protein